MFLSFFHSLLLFPSPSFPSVRLHSTVPLVYLLLILQYNARWSVFSFCSTQCNFFQRLKKGTVHTRSHVSFFFFSLWRSVAFEARDSTSLSCHHINHRCGLGKTLHVHNIFHFSFHTVNIGQFHTLFTVQALIFPSTMHRYHSYISLVQHSTYDSLDSLVRDWHATASVLLCTHHIYRGLHFFFQQENSSIVLCMLIHCSLSIFV